MELFSIHVLNEKIKSQNQDILKNRWDNFQIFLAKVEQIKKWKDLHH